MEIKRDSGIHLPGCGVWLDSLRARPLGVVSHAHSDHAAWHEETILTPATAALMQARRGSRNQIIHETPFHQPHEYSSARITLIPAGHVLGSAQVLVEGEEGTLLYTGDFKLRKSLTSERAISLRADTLVMECTFGLPRYRFPAAEQVQTEIIAFCRKAMEDRCVPVLLAYSIGKAQELLAMLEPSGLSAILHPSVYKIAKVYERFGISFGEFEEGNGSAYEGKVFIYPPNTREQLSHISNLRIAIASGWAMEKGAIYRYACDAAFVLSDHADYDELLQHVQAVAPKRVFVVHGFTEEFARDLRRLGVEALALEGKNQLELPLGF